MPNELADSYSTICAVLDRNGVIIATNSAWERFASENGGCAERCGIGINYLKVCEGSEDGIRVAAGIRSVMDGYQDEFEYEYECHSETARRFYKLRVTSSDAHRIVITHTDVTMSRLLSEPILRNAAHGDSKILLVEDHVDTAILLQMILTELGYDITIAHSVEEALKVSEQVSFDLLVSDLGLPDGTGNELFKKLNAIRSMRGVTVSARAEAEDVAETIGTGFDAHILKPVDVLKLSEVIDKVLAKSSVDERQEATDSQSV